MGKRWSEEEIQILQEGVRAKTPRKLLFLKRSISAIQHKVCCLGLRRGQSVAVTGHSKNSISALTARKNRRWTVPEIREIRRLWREGQTLAQIAERFSIGAKWVHTASIYRFIRDIPGKYKKRAWTPAEIARLRELWALPLSITEIGRQLNRERTSVRCRAHLLGLEKRP